MQLYRMFYYSLTKAPIATVFVKTIKFTDPRFVPEQKFVVSDTQLSFVDIYYQSGKSISIMQHEAKKLCN